MTTGKTVTGLRHHNLAIASIGVALLWVSSSAQATGYIAPEISYFHPDRSAFQDWDFSWGLGAGWAVTDRTRIELGYYRLRLISAVSSDIVHEDNLQILGAVDLTRLGRMTPYASFGLGASRTEMGSSGISTLPYGSIGLGLSIQLAEFAGLHLDSEVRARYSHNDDRALGPADLIDGQALLRVRFQFGSATAASDAVPGEPTKEQTRVPGNPAKGETIPEADRDGDGVPDSRDRCPNTIPNVTVDADGCMLKR